MMRLTAVTLLFLVLLPVGCRKENEPDAYGNVEAIDVVVGSEASGRIETFQVREGDKLVAGAIAGTIETTPLDLQHRQVSLQRSATASRLDEISEQIDTLEVQKRIAARAWERTKRLHAQHAATVQQLDQTERDYRVLGGQIDAARVQQQSVRREMDVISARIDEVSDRIGKGSIRNPTDGTVLAVYARAGEVTQIGQPLYRIADLTTLEIRAYVVETQLASVRLEQRARVSVDVGHDQRSIIDGEVTWVSSDAEFTPTPIQTRDERADLVYAVKIRVPNPKGVLKIGMPADVDFLEQVATR